MKLKVVMQFELRMGATDRIREVADVVIDPTLEQAVGADIVIAGAGKFDAAFMDKAGPNLKVIAKPGIGVDNVDLDAATARNILVVHTPDAPTESTAEHAVALLMAVAKRVMVGDMSLRGDASIQRSEMTGTELLGSNLGVVGYGRIGRRVAEICALGLRMNVTVYDPYIKLDQPTPERVRLTDDLDGLLRQSNFLTVHVPLMPETRHYIGEREMRLMPRGSYLINASRGPVIDEAALIRLLQEGHFAAAGLDVFDPEPPKVDSRLRNHPLIIVTPHAAGVTVEGRERIEVMAVERVLAFFRGETPPDVVNREVLK